MKRDYPELEGKYIILFLEDSKKIGKVVGCNFDVGLTIVDANDKDNYLACFNGPLSPQVTKRGANGIRHMTESYQVAFDAAVEMIEAGEMYVQELVRKVQKVKPNYRPKSCGPVRSDCGFGA